MGTLSVPTQEGEVPAMQATTTPAPFPAGVPVRQEQWSGGRIAALVIG
jgi:hypothetical protein